jgi:NAD(P)-dependent dehydrogenase (short-subunit alcohol dehydrogenase family)
VGRTADAGLTSGRRERRTRTRVACVTGCDSGIGRATALALHERGWRVYATGLDAAAMTTLDDRGLVVRELDVTDPDDAGEVLAEVEEREGRLDCLVNNAGVGLTAALETTTPDELRSVLEVNVVGTHRVTREALPLLRRTGGRVVTVTSVVGRHALPAMGAYSASKHALEGLGDVLRWEVAEQGVEVVLVEPPTTRTGFVDRVLDGLAERRAADDPDERRYERLYRLLTWWLPWLARVGASPEQVARTVVRAAETDRPRTRYPVGGQGWLLALTARLPGRAKDFGWRAAAWVADRRA